MSAHVDNKRFVLLITFISPLLGAYYAIRKLKWESKKPILILIITLFGSTLILNEGVDGHTLKQLIYSHYIDLSFDEWLQELYDLLIFNPAPETKGDVFSHFASYLFGAVLGLPDQFFILVAFIYAFFYVNSIALVLKWNEPKDKGLLFWSIIILFIVYRFIDSIQFVRTWTGGWILFYAVLRYYSSFKIKWIFLMLAAPLFHVAYFIIVIPVLLSILVRKVSPTILIIFYISSFFIDLDHASIVQQLKLTGLGEAKVKDYYHENPSEEWSEPKNNSDNWYKRYGNNWALMNAPHILIISLILGGYYVRSRLTHQELGLLVSAIMLAIFANLGDFILPFYNRTMIISGIYITATTALILLRGELFYDKKFSMIWRKTLLWLAIISFLPYFVYVIANMLQFTSIYMICMPVFGFIADLNFSIRTFSDMLL